MSSLVRVGERSGLGRERGTYDLASVELLRDSRSVRLYDSKDGTLSSFPPYEPAAPRFEEKAPERFNVELLSPLRLKEKGKLVTEETLSFRLFFERLCLSARLHEILRGRPYDRLTH